MNLAASLHGEVSIGTMTVKEAQTAWNRVHDAFDAGEIHWQSATAPKIEVPVSE